MYKQWVKKLGLSIKVPANLKEHKVKCTFGEAKVQVPEYYYAKGSNIESRANTHVAGVCSGQAQWNNMAKGSGDMKCIDVKPVHDPTPEVNSRYEDLRNKGTMSISASPKGVGLGMSLPLSSILGNKKFSQVDQQILFSKVEHALYYGDRQNKEEYDQETARDVISNMVETNYCVNNVNQIIVTTQYGASPAKMRTFNWTNGDLVCTNILMNVPLSLGIEYSTGRQSVILRNEAVVNRGWISRRSEERKGSLEIARNHDDTLYVSKT